MTIPAKAKDRIAKGIKKFQPIIAKAHASDINESDTVTIITDMLCDIFGYDKYDNVTSEFAIKKTYCDLAIKLKDKDQPVLLIECKAIGISLKDDHVRQATNYAADSGIEWVVLTNGVYWRIYKILFTKPIEKQLVYEFNFADLNPRKDSDIEMMYYLCIEAFMKASTNALEMLHEQMKILNKFVLGQLLLTDASVAAVRRVLRSLYSDIKVSPEEIYSILYNDVLKREVLDSDQAVEAKKAIAKAERKQQNAKAKKEEI